MATIEQEGLILFKDFSKTELKRFKTDLELSEHEIETIDKALSYYNTYYQSKTVKKKYLKQLELL